MFEQYIQRHSGRNGLKSPVLASVVKILFSLSQGVLISSNTISVQLVMPGLDCI